MRYPPEHKESTRQRILTAAAKVFRERGPEAASLPTIMAAAGLSIGGFYRHFESKDELFREAFAVALTSTTEKLKALPEDLQGGAFLQQAAAVYLHPAHRENRATGCPLPALAADIARQEGAERGGYEQSLTALTQTIAERIGGEPDDSSSSAWAFLATLVGGMTLARSVADDQLGREILEACQKAIDRAVPEL